MRHQHQQLSAAAQYRRATNSVSSIWQHGAKKPNKRISGMASA